MDSDFDGGESKDYQREPQHQHFDQQADIDLTLGGDDEAFPFEAPPDSDHNGHLQFEGHDHGEAEFHGGGSIEYAGEGLPYEGDGHPEDMPYNDDGDRAESKYEQQQGGYEDEAEWAHHHHQEEQYYAEEKIAQPIAVAAAAPPRQHHGWLPEKHIDIPLPPCTSLGAIEDLPRFMKLRIINTEMMLQHTSKIQGRNETQAQFLPRVSHLHLQRKRLSQISSTVHVMPNLRTCYFYENFLTKIENLEGLRSLTHLDVSSNLIATLPHKGKGWPLGVLKKIVLDGNLLTRIENLENAISLEELCVSNQRMPPANWEEIKMAVASSSSSSSSAQQQLPHPVQPLPLDFCPSTLRALSRTLKVLHATRCRLVHVAFLSELVSLEELDIKDNFVESLDECIPLASMPRLKKLDLRNNPVTKIYSYFEVMGGAANDRLVLLDDKPVPKQHVAALRGLARHKHQQGTGYYAQRDQQIQQQQYQQQQQQQGQGQGGGARGQAVAMRQMMGGFGGGGAGGVDGSGGAGGGLMMDITGREAIVSSRGGAPHSAGGGGRR